MNRLTTGTPPRLDGNTINYANLEIQTSDNPPEPLSFLNWNKGVKQINNLIDCHRTFTNLRTHAVVRDNAHLLPKFKANEGNYYFISQNLFIYIFIIMYYYLSNITASS